MSEPPPEPRRKVELRVSNQKAYVWDIEDLAVLRADHHICGVLTGTLPHLSQQNVFLGVPLVLLPEEVVLLVEKQLAIIVDDPAAHLPPTPEQLAAWNRDRIANVEAQLAAAEAKEAQEKARPARAMSEEAMRKRKEREEKRAAAARAKAIAEGADPESLTLADIAAPSASPAPAKTERPGTPASAAAGGNSNAVFTVTVPASSIELPWYNSQNATYTTLAEAKAAGVWTYPSTLFERAKCAVFKDLWEKGHFMGGGIKFGGDFLVYPDMFKLLSVHNLRP